MWDDLKSFCRAFQEFLFSHFPLINTHLEQLREGVEEAVHFRRQMSELITKVNTNKQTDRQTNKNKC